jgi:recombination protein RecT
MSNAVQVRQEQRSLVEQIKHPAFQAQISASLPPSVSLERFTAVTIAAINHNPKILQAERQSFYNSVVKAAQEGLLPDGQDAFLNVYNTKVDGKWIQKVQYQRMVGGVIKQFTKAGIDAYAESVYENDGFEFWNDTEGQHLVHRPTKPGQAKGERIAAYAIAKLASGRAVIQVMDMEQLAKAREASKSKEDDGSPKGPWRDWPERMEQKSALHRLRKRVAIIDEQAAKELNKIDDEFEDEEPPAPAEEPKQTVPTGNEARPKALQSVVEQGGQFQTEGEFKMPPPNEGGDPGPQEGDII